MSSDTLAKVPAPDIPEQADLLRIVPQRRLGQWTAAVAVLALLGLAVDSVLRTEAFQWDVVAGWFTSDSVLRGLWLTLWLTAVALGFALGAQLAAFRLRAPGVGCCAADGVRAVLPEPAVVRRPILRPRVGVAR